MENNIAARPADSSSSSSSTTTSTSSSSTITSSATTSAVGENDSLWNTYSTAADGAGAGASATEGGGEQERSSSTSTSTSKTGGGIEKDAGSENIEKKGWYPGKFISKLTKKDSGIKEDGEKKEKGIDAELKARIEEEQRSSFEKEEVEEKKQDSMISHCLRNIRDKFLKRQLLGRIYIYRISGIISTAVTSDITPDDLAQYMIDHASEMGMDSDPMIQAELNGTYKRALSMTDTILNSLERRSLAYANANDFGHSTLLTRGTTIGVSDPFIGLINLSFTIELSATAKSLLESRRRFEASRDIAICARPDVNPTMMERMGSMRESFSFSIFGKKEKGSSLDESTQKDDPNYTGVSENLDTDEEEEEQEEEEKGNDGDHSKADNSVPLA